MRMPKGQTGVFYSVEQATAASEEMAVRFQRLAHRERASFSTCQLFVRPAYSVTLFPPHSHRLRASSSSGRRLQRPPQSFRRPPRRRREQRRQRAAPPSHAHSKETQLSLLPSSFLSCAQSPPRRAWELAIRNSRRCDLFVAAW